MRWTAPFTAAVAGAVDDCFRHLGRDAVYTADGGDPVMVKVIAKRPDEIVGLGETRIHAGTALFDVRASEIAEPRPGDRLSVGDRGLSRPGRAGRRYRTPDLDAGGLPRMKLTATMVGSLKADMQAELRRIERAVPDGVKSRRRRPQGEPAQAGGRRRSWRHGCRAPGAARPMSNKGHDAASLVWSKAPQDRVGAFDKRCGDQGQGRQLARHSDAGSAEAR